MIRYSIGIWLKWDNGSYSCIYANRSSFILSFYLINLDLKANGLDNCYKIVVFQEVGSIIGKKGEIVKRFREEVSAGLGDV